MEYRKPNGLIKTWFWERNGLVETCSGRGETVNGLYCEAALTGAQQQAMGSVESTRGKDSWPSPEPSDNG